jgi:hypothetical protein
MQQAHPKAQSYHYTDFPKSSSKNRAETLSAGETGNFTILVSLISILFLLLFAAATIIA